MAPVSPSPQSNQCPSLALDLAQIHLSPPRGTPYINSLEGGWGRCTGPKGQSCHSLGLDSLGTPPGQRGALYLV